MSNTLRVLIVEDSESDTGLIVRSLRHAEYLPIHKRVETGEDMREALEKEEWDMVISDHSMPRFDALSALKILHESGQDIPFIVLSGCIGEETAVAMMKAGAHDYVMKNNLARLIPAIRRELSEAKVRQERRRAEDAAKDASEKLKFFAYSVAHDLKSPAIAVYGLARYLRGHYRDILDDKGRDYCDQLMKVSEHIVALVEKINMYIATKEAHLSIESLNLREILRMIREEFSAQLYLRQIDWLEPETAVEVRVDRISIVRVLRNLIDNSLKFGGEQLSTIRIGYEETEESHILSVCDDGRGLNMEDAEKIFGLFQRPETSRGIEGAGLGLAIVREIADQHGGKVWVDARTEQGTTFYVSISKNL
jgi:signal transduction histidine kinase